jgi:hypothetical protein
MAVFTFQAPDGTQRALDLLGISGADIEGAIKRLRSIFGASFQPVGLGSTGADSPNSLKIDAAGNFSDRFGNVVSPSDFLSGAVTGSPSTDPSGGFDGSGDTGFRGGVDTPLGSDEEAVFLRGAFNRALAARGIDVEGTSGNLFRSQFDPARLAFGVNQAAGDVAPQSTFGDFISGLQGGTGGALQGVRQQATSAFNNLLNLTGAPTGEIDPLLSPLVRPDLTSGAGQAAAGSVINNLGRQAVASRLSPATASILFGADVAPRLIEQFQTANPTAESGFLPFVQQRLGLQPGGSHSFFGNSGGGF